MVYLWRAVDAEGEVLDVLVQSKRNKHAALKLMRKLVKKYAFAPERLVTDDLRSYSAAARELVRLYSLSRRRFRAARPRRVWIHLKRRLHQGLARSSRAAYLAIAFSAFARSATRSAS